MKTLLTREQFNQAVLARDQCCIVCKSKDELVIHHIIDRSLFENGGYYKDNGVTLCPKCHLLSEDSVISCDELRELAGITEVLLPEDYDPEQVYNKWGVAVSEFMRYPRTQHIEGSSIQKGDSDEVVRFTELAGKHLVVEEKLDGSCTGVSFGYDGELLLQCRGHYLHGKGDWPEFDEFKAWANTWMDQLFDLLEDRYIMYGEWMAGFHSIYYDRLPHLFMEFDIYDKVKGVFLSTIQRQALLKSSKVQICSVRVIKEGIFKSLEDIVSLVGQSDFISNDAHDRLVREMKEKHFPPEDIRQIGNLNAHATMEGLYIKWEDHGIVQDRYKYVRRDFTQTIIDCGKHWAIRPTIWNRMAPGKSMYDWV